jgi:hypothetical protein
MEGNASPAANNSVKGMPEELPPPMWSTWIDWQYVPTMPPGLFFAVCSLPPLYTTYRDYYRPLTSVHGAAEDAVRKAAAGQIAGRALRIATYGSLGSCSLLAAIALCGYRTFEGAILDARRFSRGLFAPFEESMVRTLQPDRSHPDFARQFTEEEELADFAQTYFPGEDWTQPNGKVQSDDAGCSQEEDPQSSK